MAVITGNVPVITAMMYRLPSIPLVITAVFGVILSMSAVITGKIPVITVVSGVILSVSAVITGKIPVITVVSGVILSMSAVILRKIPVITVGDPVKTAKPGGIMRRAIRLLAEPASLSSSPYSVGTNIGAYIAQGNAARSSAIFATVVVLGVTVATQLAFSAAASKLVPLYWRWKCLWNLAVKMSIMFP
ncbi:hypothetical protein Holit_02132 [Hollandina sp. SP2]